MKGTWYNIEGRYLEYDGKTFGMGTMEVEVEQFKGPRKISSLACYPLKYHKDADVLRQQLIDRGKKFVALKGMNYRFHKGMGFYKKKRQIIKVNINGRVMVDPAIHRRINPNYPISTVKPKDPDILEEEEDSENESCGCCESSDEDRKPPDQLEDADKPKIKMKLIMDENEQPHIIEVEMDENGNEIQKEDIDRLPGQDEAVEREFSAEELLIASPVVLGFAFSEKLWLEFTVSGINDIDWNEGAFDSLVLPDNQKSIVKALVESHTFQASRNIDDVIQGQRHGPIFTRPSSFPSVLEAPSLTHLAFRQGSRACRCSPWTAWNWQDPDGRRYRRTFEMPLVHGQCWRAWHQSTRTRSRAQ